MFAGFFRLRIRQVDADHRRSLGKSVAFENFFVEALFKMAGKIDRQLFGAGDDEAQAVELMWSRFAQVHAQKRGRRQEERHFVSFNQRSRLCGVQWVRIRDNSHAFDEWIPECDGGSESVK